MALRTYNKDAWGDIEDLKTPEINNARQSAECAKIYQNNAWEEVWSAIKWLVLWEETMTTGCLESRDEETWVCAVDDNGTIAFATEKSTFSDPVITFELEGGVTYVTATGSTRYVEAGTLSIFGIDASGNTTTIESIDVGSSSAYLEPISKTVEASGEFVRIGWKMKFSDWSISPTAGNIVTSDVYVRDFKINGAKYYTNPDDDYDHNDWYS